MEKTGIKLNFKKLIGITLAALFVACLLPLVKAEASPSVVPFAKKAAVAQSLNGNDRMYSLDLGKLLNGATYVTVKSSNPKVVKPSLYVRESGYPKYSISFITKSVGKAKLTIKAMDAYGSIKTYKMKIYSLKFKNPVKSLKIGSTDYAGKFKKRIQIYDVKYPNGKAVIAVKPAKNWKVKSILVRALGSQKPFKAKNKAAFNFNKLGKMKNMANVEVTLVNKKTKQEETLYLSAMEDPMKMMRKIQALRKE